MRRKIPEGIYSTRGRERLMLINARVDGKPAVAFYKPGKDISIITMDELKKQVENKPFIEINNGVVSFKTEAV